MILAFGAVALSSAGAWAKPSVRLEYEAPDECPSLSEFIRAIESRGGSLETTSAPLVPARAFAVSIRKGEHGFSAALRVEQRDGSSGVREVRGEDCGEVVDGLAVVAAIALRENQRDEPRSPAPEAPGTRAEPQPSATAKPVRPRQTESAAPTPRFHGNSFGAPGAPWGPDQLSVPAGKLRFDTVRSITVSAGASFG